MKSKIEKADDKTKRNATTLFIFGMLVAIFSITFIENYIIDLQKVADKNPRQAFAKFKILMYVITITTMAVICGIAVWLINFCHKTYQTQRLPPPDTKVVRDTPIIYESAARQRAIVGFFMAFFLLCFACTIPFFTWMLIQQITPK